MFAPILHMLGVNNITPPATQYGYMLDYLYAVNDWDEDGTMGSNIARRRKWAQNVYVYAREFTVQEIEEQGSAFPSLPHGVFIVHTEQDEIEFEQLEEDMQATDWMIGTRA